MENLIKPMLLSVDGPSDEMLQYCVMAYDNVPIPLKSLDLNGRYLLVNKAYECFTGLKRDNFQGKYAADVFPNVAIAMARDIDLITRGIPIPNHEYAFRGRIYKVAVKPVSDDNGKPIAASYSFTDITEQKKLEEELYELAYTDVLTKLKNRRAFESALISEISRTYTEGTPTSLLMIDVDHFKQYNDTLGHPEGDICLAFVAATLRKASLRSTDLVYRVGGEEFAVILPQTTEAGAIHVAHRILEEMRSENRYHPTSPFKRVTVSIGAACLNEHYHQAPSEKIYELIATSDRALYKSKIDGRDRVSGSEQSSFPRRIG